MHRSDHTYLSAELLPQLFSPSLDHIESAIRLAGLDQSSFDHLQIRASDLSSRAIGEARDLLDVALEVLEHPLSPEHQRRLIERADDVLASAQHWNELAANARFCREHPELAKQLAGDATPSREPVTAPHEEVMPRRESRKNAASG